MEEHRGCSAALPKSKFLPTRLIEIDGSDAADLCIRLRDANGLGSAVSYATLSHRWGSSMPFKLTRSNLDSFMKSMPLREISKVFQDAICFAYGLIFDTFGLIRYVSEFQCSTKFKLPNTL